MSSPYQPFGSNNPFGPPQPPPSPSPGFPNSSFSPPGFEPQGGFAGGGQQHFQPGPPRSPPPTSPLAIMSLVGGLCSGLFAVVTCCCPLSPLAVIASLASIIMGHVALNQIHRSQGATGGKELAWFGLIAAYPALLLSGVMSVIFVAAMFSADHKQAGGGIGIGSEPGKTQLSLVETKVMSKSNGIAQGNSPEAIALAQKFSTSMKTLREAFFTEEKRKGISLSDGEFITWCELREGQCAFVVHVPSYRKFTDDAKDSLETLAWTAAQQSVRGTLAEGDALAVGMKGALLWGDVKVGSVVAPDSDDDGIEEQGKDKEALYPFFEPVDPSSDPTEVPQIKLPDEEPKE